ncbi:unnamed protein product [Brassica rapa subsp. narinosa]
MSIFSSLLLMFVIYIYIPYQQAAEKFIHIFKVFRF